MSSASDYETFLAGKARRAPATGFEPGELGAHLFPFQADIVRFAIRRGRSAVFADTGLGKSRMQATWADEVARHAGGRVLILAPLAVSSQTVREGERCGIRIEYVRDAGEASASSSPLLITNYERLDRFDAVPLAGVVLDESSVLKSYAGSTKRRILERFADTPYRLACTATPAPNDHLELGNHAEFLGVLSSHEMIARWFIADQSEFGTYRLKGHAVVPFWDWVCSWAMCVGKPSDLGYEDAGYALPPLHVREHVVDVDVTEGRGEALFREPEMNATKVHAERRRTAPDRARRIAELVNEEPGEAWLVWAETDYDCEAFRPLVPDVVEVHGSDSPESKEAALMGFVDGSVRVLLTKPKLAGFGMNFQHCSRVAFLGATFSYESFYQAIRRSWRFGQTRAVEAHVAMACTERRVFEIMRAKEVGHIEMKARMFEATRRGLAKEDNQRAPYLATFDGRLPSWLCAS